MSEAEETYQIYHFLGLTQIILACSTVLNQQSINKALYQETVCHT
jgi:hypothetical protein